MNNSTDQLHTNLQAGDHQTAEIVEIPLEPGIAPQPGRPSNSRANDIDDLWERYAVIGTLIARGLKNVDIAARIGVSAQTVSNVRNNPIVKEHIKTVLQDQKEQLAFFKSDLLADADKSIEVIRGVRDDKMLPPETRMRAAKDMLDRAGLAPVQKSQTEGMFALLTKEDIAELSERDRDASRWSKRSSSVQHTDDQGRSED